MEGLREYAPPKGAAPTDLKLDANEGLAPPASVFEVFGDAHAEHLNRYTSARPLERMIAKHLGVDPEQILITAGGDDAIMRCCRVYLHARREMILPRPYFEMFAYFAKLAEGCVVNVPWPGDDFPTDDVLAAVNDDTGIIVVTSPNNPTGCIATPEDLRRMSLAAPHALLLVDLAYAHFADKDLTANVLSLPNAVAIFTFSKAWGMAGLRVGYLAGPAHLIEPLRRGGLPFPVSSASLALAQKGLAEGGEYVDSYVARAREERKRLHDFLRDLGARPTNSHANFVYARFHDPLWMLDAMAGFGIAVRYFPKQEGFDSGIRITCPGDEESFQRLTRALETICRPESIIIKVIESNINQDVIDSLSRRYLVNVIDEKGAQLDSVLESNAPKRNWVIADFAGGVAAARRAGALPLGFAESKKNFENIKSEMHAAGAARVISDWREFKELLP